MSGALQEIGCEKAEPLAELIELGVGLQFHTKKAMEFHVRDFPDQEVHSAPPKKGSRRSIPKPSLKMLHLVKDRAFASSL